MRGPDAEAQNQYMDSLKFQPNPPNLTQKHNKTARIEQCRIVHQKVGEKWDDYVAWPLEKKPLLTKRTTQSSLIAIANS